MGIDDRDYMRARYRARANDMKWNDRSARVEGVWFARVNGRLDYQRDRVRLGPARVNWPPRWLTFALGTVLGLIMAWYGTQKGWPPFGEPVVAFPVSGSVTVNRKLDPRTATSHMKVTAGNANAVVQLFAPGSDLHLLSVYVRKGESVTVPVPAGVFRMRLIEGHTWYGPARFFGPVTRFEAVRTLQTFTTQQGGGIDLRRSPAGTMKTRVEWQSPPPL